MDTETTALIAMLASTRETELWDTREAARHLRTSSHTLEIWRSTGRHKIPYIKVGGLVRYRRSDLDAWLASRTVASEGQERPQEIESSRRGRQEGNSPNQPAPSFEPPCGTNKRRQQ